MIIHRSITNRPAAHHPIIQRSITHRSNIRPLTHPIIRRSIIYMRPETRKEPPKSVKNDWKFASVLDKIFGGPIPNDTLSLQHPYITPQTPPINEKKDLKGVSNLFIERAFANNLIRLTPRQYYCELFHASYFPPWHFISAGRKSKPALTCLYSSGHQYNGRKYKPEEITESLRSKNPVDYAVWRRKIKILLSEAFWKQYETNKQFVDGTYLFTMQRYPTNIEQLERHVEKVINGARMTALDTSMKTENWIYDSERFAGVKGFNSMLKEKNYPPVTMTNRRDWMGSLYVGKGYRRDLGEGIENMDERVERNDEMIR